jgi:hypothetical protein
MMEGDEAYKRIKDKIKDRKLTYKKYPSALWIVGIFLVIFGVYLFYHLLLPHWGGTIISSFTKKLWWQYLIASIVVVLGASFFIAGKVEMMIIDKNTKILTF